MKRASAAPRLHLFVCANRRAPDDPLGPGCGDAGDATYAALKGEVATRRAYTTIWVTKTHCLGQCPKRGCTVASFVASGPTVAEGATAALFTEVDASDAAMLIGMSGSAT